MLAATNGICVEKGGDSCQAFFRYQNVASPLRPSSSDPPQMRKFLQKAIHAIFLAHQS